MTINQIVFSDEITLWWDKEWDLPDGISYLATLDGKVQKSARSTHVTFADLTPESEYQIALTRVLLDGTQEEIANLKLQTPKAKNRLDVTKAPYNCASDGKTLVTEALQRALDDCTENDCVYFPRGTYLSGALNLHSHTEIYLDEGATLQGSVRVEDYLPWRKTRYEGVEAMSYSALLNAGELDAGADVNCEDIVIRGKGAILGGGAALCDATIESEKKRLETLTEEEQALFYGKHGEKHPWRVRSRLINLSNCAHVVIAGLTVGYAACWNVHFTYSQDIVTYGCRILSRGVWNGDGWNPDSSRDCVCFGCFFDTHDNSIAVKSGKNPEGNRIGRPAENIRIFDCEGGRCVALGSEMSGGVEKVYMWDCDFSASECGFGVKVTPKRGGYVRDSLIRNCRFTSIRMRSVSFNDDGESADTVSEVHNIRFENIRLTGMAVEIEKNDNRKPTEALLVSGLAGEENYFRNIVFDGVTFERKDDDSVQIVQVKNVKGLVMRNVRYE